MNGALTPPIRVHLAGTDYGTDGPSDIVGALSLDRVPMAREPVRDASRIRAEASRYLVATSLDDADVVFHPAHCGVSRRTGEVAAKARKKGKPCVFLAWGDTMSSIHVPYGVVYRHSLARSRLLRFERAMPAFCEDMLDGRDVELATEKSAKARVGFCGFVGTKPQRALYRLQLRSQKAAGLALRARMVRELSASSALECHFDVQTRFMGGDAGARSANVAMANAVRARFTQNVLGTDYTLCVRGAGNFSYRFYEVLSAGRTPLFIDSDCVLPFDHIIDWRKICVWIDELQRSNAATTLASIHRARSIEELNHLRRRAREIWTTYLTPLGFYRHAFAAALVDREACAAR